MKTLLGAFWRRHPATLLGVSLLAFSYGVLVLRVADVVPMSGVWRVLMIPGYLTLLGGAVLSNLLVPTILFIPVSAVLLLTPFFAIDVLLRLSKAPRAS